MAKRYSSGFTLIELLVAITILAVVAVLGWRGLDGIVRARVALTNEMEQTRGLQLAFAQMDSDCAHLALATALGGHNVLYADTGKITLVRNVYADDQPPRVQVVTYRLQDGALARRESNPTRDLSELDIAWQGAINDSGMSAPIILHSGIATMTVQAWANSINSWAAAGSVTTPGSQRVNGSAISISPNSGGNPYGGGRSRGGGSRSLQPVSGLQVVLQLRSRDVTMNKIFLLGAT